MMKTGPPADALLLQVEVPIENQSFSLKRIRGNYMKKRINVTTIGGGSGQFALLSGLKNLEGIRIKAIVSMVDSGGSTGRLRDELGALPPGDILKCILALSPHKPAVRSILQKRFEKDRRLKGHNAGNMLLTMLSRYTGSFPAGVQALAEILEARGTILPVTINRATLVAELTDGSRIYGESAIDMPRGNQREKIKDVFLVPHHSDTIAIYKPVLKAIKTADYIIMGPGDLYTSIVPNLIVPGLSEALMNTSATLIYIVNIMTKYGETNNYKADDFVSTLETFTHRTINTVVLNSKKPAENLLEQYRLQKSEFVNPDDTLSSKKINYIFADLLDPSEKIVRHDPAKLADVIRKIISKI